MLFEISSLVALVIAVSIFRLRRASRKESKFLSVLSSSNGRRG
jgi:hypothetical protein